MSSEFQAQKLGNALKAVRLEKSLTREQLAGRVGITYHHLMNIENNRKAPSLKVLDRLIRALGISADAIFYPENKADNSEAERLVRKIRRCGDKEIRAVAALVDVLLEDEK